MGLFCCFGFAQNQDSLLRVLNRSEGVERIEILHELANSNQRSELEDALGYAQESYQLASQYGDDKLSVKSLYLLSQISERQGNYSDAIDFAKEALSLAKDPYTISDINFQLGLTYESISELKSSLEYHLTSLNQREKLMDSERISHSLNSLAFVYRGMRQFEKAIKILEEMRVLCRENEDKMCSARSTFNIGLMVMEMDRHADAIPIFKEAMNGLSETDNLNQFARYYNNLANCFEKLLHVNADYYDSALYYANKSLKIKYEVGDVRGIANTHNTLAATYERNSDYQNSAYHAKIAWKLADSLGVLPIKRNALSYLITAEIKLGAIEHVNDHFEEYIDVVEELGDQVNARNLSEMTTKFETEKKIAENTLLKSEAREQQLINTFLLIGGVILFAIVLLLFYLYVLKRRTNRQLKKDKLLIQEQSEKLSELNELKTNFFANISHELRTPLTLIQGNADAILRLDKLPALAVEPTKKIKRNVKQMTVLVNDLLDLSKLELKKNAVNMKPIYIDRMVGRVVASFSSLAESKLIELTYHSDISEMLAAEVDESQFEKVLNNLIYNSFKFIRMEGRVEVYTMSNEKSVIIQVCDNGEGIPEKDLPYVFDRFYQAVSDETNKGSGLGLAISKELVEQMNGTITATNQSDGGAKLEVVLPISNLVPSVKDELVGDKEVLSGLDKNQAFDVLKIPTNSSVMVVEDNKLLQQYLQDTLQDHFELSFAENGQEALDQLPKVKPDLILTDVMMPVMNGWEFISKLRADPAMSKIPVIVLTAVAEGSDRLKGLRLGVDDYIIKPFEVEELLIRITNIIGNLRERIKWAREFEDDENKPDLTQEHSMVIQIRDYVRDHIANKQLNVTQVALHLGMSERQLYRKCAESVGLSPSKLINEIRLQHARELLVSKNFDKLAQISQEVGFESAAYFSKLYHERFGKKPTDYFS